MNKKIIKILPIYLKDCIINDVQTIEDFFDKYRKKEKYNITKEMRDCILISGKEEIKEKGYTCISKHDNITNNFICFVDKEILII